MMISYIKMLADYTNSFMIKALSSISKYKQHISVTLTIIVLVMFIMYFWHNAAVFHQVKALPTYTILAVVLLYGVFFLILALILSVQLKYFGFQIKFADNYYINIYSSIINMFGFFQGGVGVRAGYLKYRLKVNLKTFGKILFIQYLSLFAVSSMILLTISLAQFDSLINPATMLFFAVLLFSLLLLTKSLRRIHKSKELIIKLFSLTAMQLTVVSLIHWIELTGLSYDINIAQSVSYSAIVTFTSLIALTPGSIGFREGLLELANSMHGLNTDAIIVSGVVDRFLYIVLLFFIFFTYKAFRNRYT